MLSVRTTPAIGSQWRAMAKGSRGLRNWIERAGRGLVLGLAVFTTGTAGAAPAPAAVRGDRVIVRVAENADASSVGALHQQLRARVLRSLETPRRTEVVTLPPGTSVGQALAHYRGRTGIESVEPDFVLQALATPNDFFFRDQWNLRNTGMYGGTPGADIDAESAWELQRDAADIIVAVIDSGVRYTHEDIAGNMWVNPGEAGTDASGRNRATNGVDDDGNGYADDVHGINVLTGSGNPFDDWGHGTHVAGIVGGVGNNSVGVTGVAWRVKIMACKFIDAAAQYSVSDAITALDYARRHGARIVTASWGGYAFDSPALREAMAQLRAAGIIVAAAAGNDNNNNDLNPLYPASYDYDNIIAVAATNRTDGRAGYSNYGPGTVDLGAPGSPVFSAWAGSDRDYRYNEGTSMAAPHLAGACALLWARFPADSHQQIIQRLLANVDVLPSLAGLTRSGGRLNLAAALVGSAPPPPPPPPVLPAPGNLSATATSATEVRLSWTDNATTETGHELERSTDNVQFIASGSAGSNATTADVSGLSPSTSYYFRVRAVQGSARSGYSNTANVTTPAAPPPPPPPPSSGWAGAEVGAVALAGSGSGSGTSFTVSGSGADIWDRSDEFHYHYQAWTGDGTFIAQVTGLTNTDGWAKAGIMLREGTGASDRHLFIAINPSGLPALFWRSARGGITDFRSLNYSVPRAWLKLTRTANSFQASQSADGVNWTALGAPITLDLPGTLLAGFAVTSHRDGTLCTANFENASFPGGSAPPPPSVNAPTGLTAGTASAAQINLAWADNATNETGFQLERSTDNATFALVASPAANATSHSDTGLAAGTTYYYRVRAAAGSATSAYSNIATGSTAAAPPPPATVNAPTALTAATASAAQINLAWTDNATNETGFQLERSLDNATFALVASPAANVTSHSDTGLAAGTTYYYRIRAVAGGTTSAFSNTATGATASPPPPPPAGTWSEADVGAVGIAGSADASGITYTVRGSGSDVWDRADGFRFLYQTLSGDCVVEARVTSMTNTNSWAKAGVMIRESLAPGSRNAFIFLTPTNGISSQLRGATGGTTTSTAGPWGLTMPYWIRLVRTGNVITASRSADGVTWQTHASYTVSFGAQVLVGFAVTAHDNSKLNTAVFEDPFVQ